MAKGDDIQDRLVNFAVEIIKQSSQLPDTPAGRHIANQLLRCGTSPAPNYGEARGAESKNDFIHKLKLVLKELNESNVWLEILRRSELVSVSAIKQTHSECVELCKIVNSSIQTVKRNGGS